MIWANEVNDRMRKMPSIVIPFIASVRYFIEHLASGFR